MNTRFIKWLLVCVLCITGTLCLGQFTHDRCEGAKPKGKIDTIVATSYEYRKDDTARHFKEKSVNIYNTKGQLTVAYVYFYRQSFDIRLGDKEPTPTNSDYSYDDRGNVSEVRHYIRAPMLWYKSVYIYSPSTNTVKMDNIINRDNKMIVNDGTSLFTKIKLDNSGRMIEETEYQDTSRISYKRSFKYNAEGYLAEINIATGSDGESPVKILYSYFNDGNLSARVNTLYRKDYTISNTFTYTYTYTEFDEKHNWIIQNEYVNGKLTGVIERHIAYKK